MEVSRFDRLLDLAFLGTYSDKRSPEQSEWLRREIEKTANGLWPNMPNKEDDFTFTAKEVWRLLGRSTMPAA